MRSSIPRTSLGTGEIAHQIYISSILSSKKWVGIIKLIFYSLITSSGLLRELYWGGLKRK